VALLVGVVVLIVLPGVGPAAAAGRPAAAPHGDGGPPNQSAFDWLELNHDSHLSGDAANSTLSATNAATLGVRWAQNMDSAALDSPVVSHSRAGMLTFIGTESGDELAFKVGNARPLWGRVLGGRIVATSVVSDGAVWVESEDPGKLFKLNLLTGATECSVVSRGSMQASITAGTPPGGKPSVYIAEMDTGGVSGPVVGVAASNCGVEWQFSAYHIVTGSWAPMSYGVDANSTPLVLVGTSDPDDSEYAIDALTGKEVWRFQGLTPGDYDIGAGATISPPGVNGFADGVAYVPSKYGTIYALNLTTGATIWSYAFDSPPVGTATETGRSSAALDGTNLVFGHLGGVIDLDAVTGTLNWQYGDPTGTEVLSSVAIAGEGTRAVVACADLGGALHVLELSDGQDLYDYQTRSYIVSSPAVSDGDVLIASTDGLLYDFAVGGGNDATLPTVSATSPAQGATLANPGGDEVIKGTAADPIAVTSVDVAIESGGSQGAWWDSTTRSWTPAPIGNLATLSAAGEPTTRWSFALPVPSYGGSYQATVTAHSGGGQASIGTDQLQFAVSGATSGPRLSASQFYVAPGGSLTVDGGGFAHGEAVTISLQGKRLASTRAGSGGVFGPTTVTFPGGSAFGESFLLATATGSSKRATVPVYISNTWSDPGHDAGHSGYAPNDESYSNIIFAGSNSGIYPAWDFIAGSAIGTSVAVADDVAYVGDASGQLLAIDTQNGSNLWTWQNPSGGAIDGAPTVDPALGRVMVGTADGSVDAVSTSGHLLWSTSIGGAVNAATFGGGEIYVSSTDGSSGAVAALTEATGAVTWSQSLTGPATAAVSLDTAAGLLIVGASDGTVTALSTAAGAPAWTFTAGGAVDASPAVSGASVYVGAADDTLYALSAATGEQRWTYVTGGPITASPAILNQEVFVGAGDGSVTGLSSSGSVDSVDHYDAPVTGLAAVSDAVFVTSGTGLDAIRPDGLQGWAYDTGGSITAAPAIDDGAVYVGNANGNLFAFTPYGRAPL